MKRRYAKITQEIKDYIKKLYSEELSYAEITKRVEAEFAYKPSNGVIHRYGTGKKHKPRRKTHVVPPSQSTARPCYCAYCGNRL